MYLDRLAVSTDLIKPGRIRVTSGSDPDYYPGQWVIRVSGSDPVSTLGRSRQSLQSNHGIIMPL